MRIWERVAATLSRLVIVQRSLHSCDAGDRPGFSSHASQNAAFAEQESENGAGRLALAMRESSQRR